MSIASGNNGRCVDRAISTVKAILGLRMETELATPDNGIRDNKWVALQFAREFSDRAVKVWCEPLGIDLPANVTYAGEWYYGVTDDEHWAVAFVYGDKGDEDDAPRHMVVGLPGLGYDMKISFVVAVALERDRE